METGAPGYDHAGPTDRRSDDARPLGWPPDRSTQGSGRSQHPSRKSFRGGAAHQRAGRVGKATLESREATPRRDVVLARGRGQEGVMPTMAGELTHPHNTTPTHARELPAATFSRSTGGELRRRRGEWGREVGAREGLGFVAARVALERVTRGRADRRLLSVLCLQFSENYLHSLSRVFGRSVRPPICRVERARRAPEFHSVDVAHQSLSSTFRRRSCQHIQVGVIQTKSSLPQLSPRIRAMAEHAQAFRTPLMCLLLCLLLLLSSPQRATSKHHDADDDRGTFSGGQARRTLSGSTMPEGLSMPNHNSSNSSRAGAAFCRLLSLQILDLSNNQFTGELPDCWWNLQALQFMDLSNNSFSGEIPTAKASHNCSLESLHLAGNSFTGVVPPVLKGCDSLATLDLGNNRFFGGIPPWIGTQVPSLRILSFRSNNFIGEIPPELSQLSQLQLLDMANNSFTGPIPVAFGNLTSMRHPEINSSLVGSLDGSNYQDRIDIIWKGQQLIFQRTIRLLTGIDLSANLLSECIPDELTKLQGLRFLNLSRNNLSCGIPRDIGSLSFLESLDLSSNELSGAIPQSISTLSTLSTLNISNNHLAGKIPSGSQIQTLNDPSIFSNNYGLCGFPLDPCANTTTSLASDERNAQGVDQWLCYSVVAGVVFGFWLWFGMLLQLRPGDLLFSFMLMTCSV